MKKLIILSLISLSMFMSQLHSISLAEYIQQNGVPELRNENRYYGKILDLAHKNLTSLEGLQDIPTEVLAQVQILDLSFNQLQELPIGIFNGLNKLTGLNLSGNKLQILPTGIFDGLNNLQKLYLNNNQLKELPTDIFKGLHNLKHLTLNSESFMGDFLLSLPSILHDIPTLQTLDYSLIDEVLKSKSYRVYNPKTLQDITKEYAMQNLISEQIEELAVAKDPAFDLLPLTSQQKAEIIAKNIDAYRDRLHQLPQNILDLLPLTPQQRAGITAEKRQIEQ